MPRIYDADIGPVEEKAIAGPTANKAEVPIPENKTAVKPRAVTSEPVKAEKKDAVAGA